MMNEDRCNSPSFFVIKTFTKLKSVNIPNLLTFQLLCDILIEVVISTLIFKEDH